jgi:hypothetical protein
MALQAFVGPCSLFFSFVIIFTQIVGLLGRLISPSQGRCLQRTTQPQNKRIHRHPCLWVGFESTIPAFERAKTVHTYGYCDRPNTSIAFLKYGTTLSGTPRPVKWWATVCAVHRVQTGWGPPSPGSTGRRGLIQWMDSNQSVHLTTPFPQSISKLRLF